MSDEPITHIISVQPYGYIDGPDDHRPGAEGSRARLNKGIEIALSLVQVGQKVIFLFPQGYGKDDPARTQGRSVSLGESMARYVDTRMPKEFPGITVHFKPMSWGTMNDLKALVRMMHDLGISPGAHIHLVTDPTHLKRVQLIWYRLPYRRRPVTFHAAIAHRMSWKERWVREPLARLKCTYELTRGR